jgi:hypothetical protein
MTVRRRPLHRANNLHIETTLEHYTRLAPEIELGWTQLRQAINDAGWRNRTPEDDRRAYTGPDTEPSGLDYNDTTGDLALRLDNLAGDLDTLEAHWDLVKTSLRALAKIARRNIPPLTDVPISVPPCSVSDCDGRVEKTPSGGYRGMELVAGHWVAKPGVRPLCAKHRTAQRRDIA